MTDPTRLAIFYLALPNFIFLVGWFTPWVAAIGVAALLCALRPMFDAEFAGRMAAPRAQFVALLIVALAWSAFGGAGHLFHASSDWVIRGAVLRDLVAWEWPVGYRTPGGVEFLLRAPIGYFLPAAIVGKATSAAFADTALLAWTALGVWLFLALVVDGNERPARLAWKIAVVILFSGMDLIGLLIYRDPVSVTGYFEWWGRMWQYSSNTNLLFWVPNHALPGWLAAAILYRSRGHVSAIRVAPLLLALIALWSPLTAVGVLPLALAAGMAELPRRGIKALIDPVSAVGATVVAVLVAIYLTTDIVRIPSAAAWQPEDPVTGILSYYALFVALEFALLFGLIVTVDRSTLVLAAGATLFLLPLYKFGPANDLAMRASIPSLAILAMASIDAIPRMLAAPRTRWRGGLAIAFLVVGSATPATEFARATLRPRWAPDLDGNLYTVSKGAQAHYMARLNRPALAAALRVPVFRPVENGKP